MDGGAEGGSAAVDLERLKGREAALGPQGEIDFGWCVKASFEPVPGQEGGHLPGTSGEKTASKLKPIPAGPTRKLAMSPCSAMARAYVPSWSRWRPSVVPRSRGPRTAGGDDGTTGRMVPFWRQP